MKLDYQISVTNTNHAIKRWLRALLIVTLYGAGFTSIVTTCNGK